MTIKESLNQAMLEKDVLESAKEGLSGALSKVRIVMGVILLPKGSVLLSVVFTTGGHLELILHLSPPLRHLFA